MLSATTTSPPLSLPPAGEEQPGDRPGLPTEDAGAAAGAGADGAPGDAGAAQRQVRVHRGGQVRHHARYAPRLLHRIPPLRRSTPCLARYLDLALFLDLALYFRVCVWVYPSLSLVGFPRLCLFRFKGLYFARKA